MISEEQTGRPKKNASAASLEQPFPFTIIISNLLSYKFAKRRDPLTRKSRLFPSLVLAFLSHGLFDAIGCVVYGMLELCREQTSIAFPFEYDRGEREHTSTLAPSLALDTPARLLGRPSRTERNTRSHQFREKHAEDYGRYETRCSCQGPSCTRGCRERPTLFRESRQSSLPLCSVLPSLNISLYRSFTASTSVCVTKTSILPSQRSVLLRRSRSSV